MVLSNTRIFIMFVEIPGEILKERINSLISDFNYECTKEKIVKIHEFLFEDYYIDSGKFRICGLRKKQRILSNDTVEYAKSNEIHLKLDEILFAEKVLDYNTFSENDKIIHIAEFISKLWQIHPFRDGNTRTIVVFLIKHLIDKGFIVTNKKFKHYSIYFRNTLVRAVYENKEKGIIKDISPLVDFLKFVIFNIPTNLRSKYLQI